MESCIQSPLRPLVRRVVQRPVVTVLLQCTNLGGMEQVAFALFERLGEQGYSFKIATPRAWGLGQARVLEVDPAAKSFEYRGKFGWRTHPSFREHVQRMSDSSRLVWVIGACASCLAAARSTGKRVLLSHHYHHIENRFSRIKWTAFYLAFGPSLSGMTYPTEFTRGEAARIAPWLRSKLHVVRNGFAVHYKGEPQRLAERAAARATLGIPQDAFVVGNAGWLIKRKRFDIFLKTAAQAARRVAGSQFIVCGGGPEEENLRRLSAELGIARQVRFVGWVQDLSVHYRAWDALLFNSDFDTLPCAPMEAASYGCISVASCLYGGLSEFLKTGRTGILFPKHNPEELADVLAEIANAPAFAGRLREGAVAQLRGQFSVEAGSRFYEKWFDESCK